MKISKAEMRILVKHFKSLVELDVAGITSTDARSTVKHWLEEVGQEQTALDFEHAVWKYQTSPKVRRWEREYNDQHS